MSEATEHEDGPAIRPHAVSRMLVALRGGFLWLIAALAIVWTLGAIYYLPWLPLSLRRVLAVAYVITTSSWLLRRDQAYKVVAILGTAVAAYLLLLFTRPSNDRDWAADQSRVARVSVDGEQITIDHFRNFQYRTAADFDQHFETRRFLLHQIRGVWFVLQKFTAGDRIAHTFVSFELDIKNSENRYFSVSIEARREQGETYSPIAGIYRNYELAHIIGDERDLIGVRTVHRPNDRVWLYRTNATPDQARQLFLKFARRIQNLHDRPRHYHTLLDNCINGITHLTYGMTPEPIDWMDPRIVLPGYSDQYAFDHGLIGNKSVGETFDNLRQQCRIDLIAKEVGISNTFPDDIRKSALTVVDLVKNPE